MHAPHFLLKHKAVDSSSSWRVSLDVWSRKATGLTASDSKQMMNGTGAVKLIYATSLMSLLILKGSVSRSL